MEEDGHENERIGSNIDGDKYSVDMVTDLVREYRKAVQEKLGF